MNAFKDWTPAMAEAHNMRVRAKKGLPMIEIPQAPKLNVTTIAKTKKELLNKTEKAWKAELERRGHKTILVQALMFRLGDRLQYRPDLTTVEQSASGLWMQMTCYETKAPHRFAAGSLAKPKMAAKLYPFVKFVIVKRDKGQWTEKEVRNE